MNGRRNGRGATTRGRRPRGTAGLVTKRELVGHEVHITRPDPSPVNRRPWYPLVVQFVVATPDLVTYFTNADIARAVTNQLGLSPQAQAIMNIKIKQVEAWATSTPAATDRPACKLEVNSLQPTLGDPATPGAAEVFYAILKTLSDTGSASKAACVSYKWPHSEANKAISSQAPFITTSYSGNMANGTVRFHVLWTTTDTAVPVEPPSSLPDADAL